MNEHRDFYQHQLRPNQPWPDVLMRMKQKALDELKSTPFPTRHDEDWKYTQVQGLLSKSWTPVEQATSCSVWSLASSKKTSIPDDIIAIPLCDALVSHSTLLTDFINQSLKKAHAFHLLNEALLSGGYLIYVPKNIRVDEPLLLSHSLEEGQSSYSRHVIIQESGSHLSLIEDFMATGESYANVMTEISLAEDATLNHYKILRESEASFHTSHVAVTQAAKSQYAMHSVYLNGHLTRSDLSIALTGSASGCLMNGIYMPGDNQHVDHHTLVEHLVPSCHSKQDYKGVVFKNGRAVFNGRVMVAKDAQKTIAEQQNKNLLLDAHSEVNTKPELQIFADDVICSHGATVGQLDEEAMFYLATRGIDEKTAQQYLIHAFALANLELISEPKIKEWILTLLNQQLERRL